MNGYIKGWLKQVFNKKVSSLSFVHDNCKISPSAVVYRQSRLRSVVLGDYSYIGKGSIIHNTTIGRFCSISDYCMIASNIACFPGTHSTLWEQAVGVGLPIICKRWDGMDHVNVNGNCRFISGENVSELSEILKEITQNNMLQGLSQLAVQASSAFLYSNISRKAIGE